jgi:hypothetical protein
MVHLLAPLLRVVAMAYQSLALDEMGSGGMDTLYGCCMAYAVTMIIAIATPLFSWVALQAKGGPEKWRVGFSAFPHFDLS